MPGNVLQESIAMQLARISSTLKGHMCEAIKEHSDIATRGSRDQWNHLVLGLVSRMKPSSLESPLIPVVDVLDKCEGQNDVRLILSLFR